MDDPASDDFFCSRIILFFNIIDLRLEDEERVRNVKVEVEHPNPRYFSDAQGYPKIRNRIEFSTNYCKKLNGTLLFKFEFLF